MDPVLVDERELGVEVQQVLVCGSASDYGEQTAVRILLEAYIAVGEGLILDVLGSLDGEEALDVFPKSGDDGSLSGSKQISGSDRKSTRLNSSH